MRSCFNEMLEDEGFFNWLSAAVGFKPVRLRNLLSANRPNNRSSKLPPSDYQQIYDFWLQHSITSTDSTNSQKRITKMAFLQWYKLITDENLREKEITFKKGKKTVYTVNKVVYVESMRKLLKGYNSPHTPVSLTFFTYKPFYCYYRKRKAKLCMHKLPKYTLVIRGYQSLSNHSKVDTTWILDQLH